MDLEPGQAHVWTLPLDVIEKNTEAPVDDPLFEKLESILSDDEIDRSRLFAFENNRREYIAAHALCRVMLSRFGPISPKDWQFDTGPHGRPEIAKNDNVGNLRFNISHTQGLVAVAVTRDDDIGVDVEWIERNTQFEDVARAKFAKPEVALLDAAAKPETRRTFFSFWTLKESYIKAIGKGLAEPLDGFAFSLDPLGIDFLHAQDDPQEWCFQLNKPAPDYLGAVAVRRGTEKEPDFVHRAFDIAELARMGGVA